MLTDGEKAETMGAQQDGDDQVCADLNNPSLDDDLAPAPQSQSPHPVAPATGARHRGDAALLRLCRVMTVATIRAGNAQEPPLTSVQIRVLTMLAAADRPLNLGEVARCLGATLSAASRVCSRLVREGCVLRDRGPGNEIRLSLSPSGISALTTVNQNRLTRLHTLLDALPPEEHDTVLAAAELLAETTTGSGDLW